MRKKHSEYDNVNGVPDKVKKAVVSSNRRVMQADKNNKKNPPQPKR